MRLVVVVPYIGAGGEVVTRRAPIDEVPVWCRTSAWPALREIFADLR